MGSDRGIGRRQRQQLIERRALGHGVHEVVVDKEDLVDLATAVRVQHHLDHANQLVDVRDVAQVRDRGEHVHLDAAEEHRGLLADGHHIDFDALLLPVADFAEQLAEEVVIEAARQTAVR